MFIWVINFLDVSGNPFSRNQSFMRRDILGLDWGDECISCIKLPKRSAALLANTLPPYPGLLWRKTRIYPQEVVRSCRQQLQPTSVGPATARRGGKKSILWWGRRGNEAKWEMMRWQGHVRGNHSEIFETCSCSFTLGMHSLNSQVHQSLTSQTQFLICKCLFSDISPFSLLSPLESSCFSRPMKSSHCFGVRPNTSLFRFHSWSQMWLRLFSSSWVTKESPHGKIIARQTAQADLCPLVQNRIPLWEWSKLPFFPYRSAL